MATATRKRKPKQFVGDGLILVCPSGQYVDPLDLKVEEVSIRDIAHHLAQQTRFSGATKRFYSVAQHSTLCAARAAELGHDVEVQLEALLHDAQEYVLQDMVRPLKEKPRYGAAYRAAERRAEKVIRGRFGLPSKMSAEVKEIDNQLLAAERRDLLPPTELLWEVLEGVEPPGWKIMAWDSPIAEHKFMQRYFRLQIERGER